MSTAWLSDSSPAREMRLTVKHAPVYLVVVGITYSAELVMARIGYAPPEPLNRLMSVTPGLLVLFMPLTPFLFFLVGTYYDLREYIKERQLRRRRLDEIHEGWQDGVSRGH